MLQPIINKFKENYKNTIISRYINDDIEELEELLKYLDDSDNHITLEDESMTLIEYYFTDFLMNESEEVEEFFYENIEESYIHLLKFFIEIINQIIYNKKNNINFNDIISKEKLRIESIKSKVLITTKELEECYGIEERHQQKLRTEKKIPYYQDKDQYGFGKKGAKVFYKTKEILEWLEAKKHN
ncbi:hypothetical protein CRV00_12025 [Malaciobacter molluscorum]|nr:hypothetical protein CRV00_12025 [Malaciobacter molluscorum]